MNHDEQKRNGSTAWQSEENDSDVHWVEDGKLRKKLVSAFFFFTIEYQRQFKEKYCINSTVASIGKACGAKCKLMSKTKKAPLVKLAQY